ncbi:MAG: ABC transporter ATP-binding protein [Pirellulaceae bacterium]|nr:ABC transporter ATP-binding protein [Planctomycetales bacterium]
MLIETESLTKRYGDFAALSDCTMDVAAGEVFGLLGPNGAGKTTLLRLLLGFLQPTSGRATIDGCDCQRQSVAVRERTSYLPGEARLFGKMRGREVLDFFADVRPSSRRERFHQLAERLELDTSRRVAMMSTGMRQKLALAVTLGAESPLVILDEPTANLDPTVRAQVVRLVMEAKQAGQTVLFSSHVLSEVEEACDRVAILRGGLLVHTQAMADLRRRHRIRATLTGTLPAPPADYGDQLTVRETELDQVIIETPLQLGPLFGWLSNAPLAEVRIEPVGLRAVYERFHGETAHDA